ncbi:MAG: HU family DNA-binding protein [Alphaproteobacteria bacterium]
MTRAELIDLIHKRMPEKSHKEVEKAVGCIFEEILHALEGNKRVEIRNFGSFLVKKRRERQGVDPRNGSPISLQNRYVPFFKAGGSLIDFINRNKH